MKKMTLKTIRLAFFLFGIFLLWGIIEKIGWINIGKKLDQLDFWFVPILLTGFFWYLCYTVAWKLIIRKQENNIPFWTLFRAKLAGEAVNTMQPANFLGGDPMRVYLLRRYANVTSLTASVVVDRTVNSLAMVAVIFVGATLAFLTLPGLPREVSIGVPIFLGVASAMLAWFFVHQKRGLFVALFNFGKRLPIIKHKIDPLLPKLQELDEKVLKLYDKDSSSFWESFAFHTAGRFLGIVEVYLIGQVLSPDFTLLVALFLATLAPVVNACFTFIPGALGILEGAYSGALYLLGLDPAIGLTIQIVKRIRSMLWIGLGILFISLFRNPQKHDDNEGPLQRSL